MTSSTSQDDDGQPSGAVGGGLTLRLCRRCKVEKPLNQFSKDRSSRDGLETRCKSCRKDMFAAYASANKEKRKAKCEEWREAHPNRSAKYYAAHPERCRSYQDAYRKRNPEKTKVALQTWRNNNKDKIRESRARYHLANRDRSLRASSLWSKAHPEARRLKENNRRALKKLSGGKLTAGLDGRLMALQRGRCAVCNTNLSKVKRHLDHIVPLALGGANTDSNIQLLCQPCNQSKHAKHPVEFMQSRGFLL